MLKRSIALLLMLCLLFPAAVLAQEDGQVQVTASFFPIYVAAINVLREVPGVSVGCLAPPSSGCLHDYQMTTDDRKTLSDTDILLLNGAGLESFLEKILPTLEADVIDTSEGVPLLEEEDGPNAHIWVSVPAMQTQVKNMAGHLAALLPEHAGTIEANAEAYVEKLQALYEEMRAQLASCAGAPIMTFHEAFDYFARDFDLRVVSTVVSHHMSQPSSRELARLADLARTEEVRALFAEPQYEDVSVQILSKETGIPVYLLDPATSGEVSPDNTDAYLDIMRQNANTLAEALQ